MLLYLAKLCYFLKQTIPHFADNWNKTQLADHSLFSGIFWRSKLVSTLFPNKYSSGSALSLYRKSTRPELKKQQTQSHNAIQSIAQA